MAAPGAPLSPASLQTPQLRSLERQLEEENTLLTANFNQLKMAQQKFTDAAAVVAALTPDKKGKEILVPLTGSLYVAGVLDPEERLLVDIGTSFYVGKTAADARELLLRKATLLRANTETLYRVIHEKRSNLDTVQEELQRRQ